MTRFIVLSALVFATAAHAQPELKLDTEVKGVHQDFMDDAFGVYTADEDGLLEVSATGVCVARVSVWTMDANDFLEDELTKDYLVPFAESGQDRSGRTVSATVSVYANRRYGVWVWHSPKHPECEGTEFELELERGNKLTPTWGLAAAVGGGLMSDEGGALLNFSLSGGYKGSTGKGFRLVGSGTQMIGNEFSPSILGGVGFFGESNDPGGLPAEAGISAGVAAKLSSGAVGVGLRLQTGIGPGPRFLVFTEVHYYPGSFAELPDLLTGIGIAF